jgi:hypothetical protein
MKVLCICSIIVLIFTGLLILLINVCLGPLTKYIIVDVLLWLFANFMGFIAMAPCFLLVYGDRSTTIEKDVQK